jgi:uncharacterized protein DUF547
MKRPLLACAALAAASLMVIAASCENVRVRPQAKPMPDVPSAGKFPHERFGLVLDKAVTADGLVDYAKLALDGQDLLDEYMAELGRVSPDSHPHLFPTEEDKLAYWINAHNACALRGVLRWNRPRDFKSIAARFDGHTSYVLGGREMTLDGIVTLIRHRFQDARVHFVLVRGRRGGPPLSKKPFDPATLEAQLDTAARAFVASDRYVQWTPPSTDARIARLFFEFRPDFERLMPSTVSGDARLVAAINRWREPRAQLVVSRLFEVSFDERLNDAGNL